MTWRAVGSSRGTSQSRILPAGVFLATIESLDYQNGRPPGSQWVKLRLRDKDGHGEITDVLSLDPSRATSETGVPRETTVWKAFRWFEALAIPDADYWRGPMNERPAIDWSLAEIDKRIGSEVVVWVELREYQGQMRSEVVRLRNPQLGVPDKLGAADPYDAGIPF